MCFYVFVVVELVFYVVVSTVPENETRKWANKNSSHPLQKIPRFRDNVPAL